MTGSRRLRKVYTAVCIALVLLLPAISDSATATGQGPLDGMAFTGEFGPEGKSADRTDTIYFGDGMFWSANCVPCGFAPGKYWIRYADDGIYFRGELNSPDRGSFIYSGVVRDSHITVEINWQRDRWYWSVNRNFWFKGNLTPADQAVSAERAVKEAIAANPGSALDCDPERL